MATKSITGFNISVKYTAATLKKLNAIRETLPQGPLKGLPAYTTLIQRLPKTMPRETYREILTKIASTSTPFKLASSEAPSLEARVTRGKDQERSFSQICLTLPSEPFSPIRQKIIDEFQAAFQAEKERLGSENVHRIAPKTYYFAGLSQTVDSAKLAPMVADLAQKHPEGLGELEVEGLQFFAEGKPANQAEENHKEVFLFPGT